MLVGCEPIFFQRYARSFPYIFLFSEFGAAVLSTRPCRFPLHFRSLPHHTEVDVLHILYHEGASFLFHVKLTWYSHPSMVLSPPLQTRVPLRNSQTLLFQADAERALYAIPISSPSPSTKSFFCDAMEVASRHSAFGVFCGGHMTKLIGPPEVCGR